MKISTRISLCVVILTVLITFCDGCILFHKHSAYRSIHEYAIAGDAAHVAADLESHPNDLNLLDDGGLTPLHLAVLHCHTNVVDLLLKNGADVNHEGKDNETPLHLAAQEGCIDAVSMLLEKGANVNPHDRQRRTPLTRAKQWHQDVTVEFIRQHGGTE
jgi:ankyrin repeat protein